MEATAGQNGHFNLSEQAILVRLSTGKASTSGASQKATDAAVATCRVNDPERVRSRAQIIAKDAMKEIQKAVSKASGTFYACTIPWDDSGYRVLPCSLYTSTKAKIVEAIAEFEDAADRLALRRDELERDAQASLGDLFAELQFPSADELRKKFSMELKEMPIANPNDIRLKHMNPEQVKEIQAGIEAQMAVKIKGGQEAIVKRIFDMLEAVQAQCGKEKGRIYDSLLGNIEKAVEILPSLNINDDPDIARLIGTVRDTMLKFDVEDLRSDPTARVAAAKAAGSIISDLRSFSPVEFTEAS